MTTEEIKELRQMLVVIYKRLVALEEKGKGGTGQSDTLWLKELAREAARIHLKED